MEFRASYLILSELNLVIQYIEGDVSYDLVTKFRKEVVSDPLYQSDYARINDFRRANIIISPELINNYSEFEQSFSNNTPRKIAIITRTPDQVVASKLYGFYLKDKTVVEVVSTVEKACSFLIIGANSVELINRELSKLRLNVSEPYTKEEV